jgi:hypothetical protein
VAEIDYTRVLPTGYMATGAGWMTSRSGWGADATQVVMICGPTREAHQDRAQNGFMIFRGDWLAAAARLKSHDGLRGETEFNNTLTIGGTGQRWLEGARALHFADTPRYAYFAGEAGATYDRPTTRVLSGFQRELLFLKPGIVVVLDRVDALDPLLVKKWHLHTLNEPVVDGSHYRAGVDGAMLFGTSLLPRAAVIGEEALHIGTFDRLSSWRLDIAAPVGLGREYFLNVLEAAPASEKTPTPVSAVVTSRGSLIGAQVGGQVVLFDQDPTGTFPLIYREGSLGTKEHFILNQEPGKWYRLSEFTQDGQSWYQVTSDSVPGDRESSQVARASDQGVVYFVTKGEVAPRYLPLRYALPRSPRLGTPRTPRDRTIQISPPPGKIR